MVVVPAIPLVTVPELAMVATAVLVLVHTPPLMASVSVVVAPPAHNVVVPDIAAGVVGSELTVTSIVAATLPHPFVTV